jgi:hypothetical protein
VAPVRVIAVLSLIVCIGAASGIARAYWEERRAERRRGR